MSSGTILIRVDASAEIGTGHVMRCLALAQAWQDSGRCAVFLLAQSTSAVRARLAREGCAVISVAVLPGSMEDANQTSEFARRYEVDWVVIDGYSFRADFLDTISRSGHRVLCIDDGGELDYYPADLVLNQNLNANENWYRRRASHAQLLLGPGYCLLRREFARWREWQREISASPCTALLTLGGSPSAEIGIRVMESLGRINLKGFQILFAVGGSSRAFAQLETCAAQFADKISVRKDVQDMTGLMAAADIAISAAGCTCWELCFFGVPMVLLDVAPNQTPVAKELHRQGCAVHLGTANQVEPAEIASAIETLLSSQNIRESLSQRCRQLVDGLGAQRVVAAMQSAARRPALARSHVESV
ncbi:MAG TPA: UDP-2,4-diacetamido-2,4,6-trideoxy-beta-L-altropyranose hydrolase [Terriglobales bacterium]|nr:UDP-2,4-diacetamido-2,4,6-trideoxy-beta-L-altropyranose hydrolase [Terriglobales bacterium]